MPTSHIKVPKMSFSFRPGLGTVAVIGALTWIFGLWVGPMVMPVQTTYVLPSHDLEHEIDAMRHPLALSTPEGESDLHIQPEIRIRKVRPGDTLIKVLTRAQVNRREAHKAIQALRSVFKPRDLSPGTKLKVIFQPLTNNPKSPRSFRGFEFKPSVKKTVSVMRSWDNRFEAHLSKIPLTHVQAASSGVIKTSLYVDAVKAGIPVPVIVEMIRTFSFEVDFQRDIHPRDGFKILYDKLFTPNGELAKTGDIIYASLTLKGKDYPLYRFRLRDGTLDYFNHKGESVRKALMRTPIDGARLSSRFGRRRHPILGYMKAHRGIDFAAPRGTPIMAAGRGVVVAAGRNGSYGLYVRIRHNTTYSTAYAHMRGIARSIRRGRRVRQGQTIGYVGTTGRSTGPHLHYEILRNNRRINPLGLKLPSGKKLKGNQLRQFQVARTEIDKAYAALPKQMSQKKRN
jgi:murein DD-endopeptidase MepM/ murein hydrolase activator NlpD